MERGDLLPFGDRTTNTNEPRPLLEAATAKTFRLRNDLPFYVETRLIPRIVQDAHEGHATVRCGEVAYEVEVGEDGITAIVVQKHNEDDPCSTTDLASIPWFLWSLLGPYGKQLRPALLHDRLCERALESRHDRSDADRGLDLRREADALFRKALSDENVWWYRRWIFWTGVSLGRYWEYKTWVACLLGVQVVVSTLVIYASCIVLMTGDVAVGLTLLVAPLALSFLWMRNYRLPLVATFASPIVLPFMLLSLSAALLLWLPDVLTWAAIWLIGGQPDARPELLPRRRLVQ